MECRSRNAGPGPGAYNLPSTVGYPKHDPSRRRNPQYTMGTKPGGLSGCTTPGPYDVGKTSRFGKVTTPAYSLASRPRDLGGFATPGPGTYTLKSGPKNPAYTMAARYTDLSKCTTPGPNQYLQPSTIGPKVPHKPASAAYSMLARHPTSQKDCSPGPARYSGIPTDIYRPNQPKYTLHLKNDLISKQCNPGPATYYPKPLKSCSTGYSFGIKHCATPYITAEDDVPCVNQDK